MIETERAEVSGRTLLLYDGACALCNGVVSFLLKRDKQGLMRFEPLESALGREMRSRLGVTEALDGIVLITDALGPRERVYSRSDAAVVALEILGGRWRWVARLLRRVPRKLRELAYGVVAQVRYRLFGRYPACPIPPAALRHLLLGSVTE